MIKTLIMESICGDKISQIWTKRMHRRFTPGVRKTINLILENIAMEVENKMPKHIIPPHPLHDVNCDCNRCRESWLERGIYQGYGDASVIIRGFKKL